MFLTGNELGHKLGPDREIEMGLSLSWVAVRGPTREAVLEALGLQVGGKRLNQALGELPGGWWLYVDSDFDRGFKAPLDRLVALGAPTVACRQDDHVMFAEARGYDAGRELWRVVRDCEEEPWMDVAATGELPAQFAAIRAKWIAEQETEGGQGVGVDLIYEIPLELAQSICGYRPDEGEAPELVALTSAAGGGGFLARLFGRG